MKFGFRDMDGTLLNLYDEVVIVYWGLPIGRLIRGQVVDIGSDYVEIHSETDRESIFVHRPEEILYLTS